MGEKTVIILHSGDMDKVYSALIIRQRCPGYGYGGLHILYLLGADALEERRA